MTVGWTRAVCCRGCGDNSWTVVSCQWTCSCGRVMHDDPMSDPVALATSLHMAIERTAHGLRSKTSPLPPFKKPKEGP
jgi:hypothetical protein